MKHKSICMGVIGLLSLIIMGITLTLAIVFGNAGYWFAFAFATIAFFCDNTVEEKNNDIGQLHLFVNEEGYKAVGFEFKVPVDQIAQMTEVKMCVHVSDGAEE